MQRHVSSRRERTTAVEYGTFDPLTLERIPPILIRATLLASNGGIVSGGGRDEEGFVAGLLRFAPSTPLPDEKEGISAFSIRLGSIGGVAARSDTETRTATSAPITGLSHFQLLVADVDASARWYAAALGLLPFARDSRIGYVALRHRGAKFVVVLTQGPRPAGGPDEFTQHLDHLAFAVPDGESLRTWADRLTEIGVHHNGIILENGHPSLQLRDPDGIAIELVAP